MLEKEREGEEVKEGETEAKTQKDCPSNDRYEGKRGLGERH
jgi:hypothetical protein